MSERTLDILTHDDHAAPMNGIIERYHQEALLKAGALQSAIFNSANFSSIATDANGVIQIFNVGAEQMLGYTAAEVINNITPADISDPQEVITRAESLSVELGTLIMPGFEALIFKASRGIEDIYELTYIRKDGSRFPAVVSVTALRDAQDTIIGYLLIGTDNTARKHAEESIQAASQYARSLIEASQDPLVMISAQGKITDVNAATEQVTGVSRNDLINSDFAEYFSDPEKAREGYEQAFLQGFVTDYPLAIRHVSGKITYVLYNASLYRDANGNVLGVFAAARDITARKHAEEELLKAGALQSAIFNSANFSSIATDANGVIQIFNVGAEQMLGYTAAEVMNKITPADISDPQEVIARAESLSLELGTPIMPGFEALVFKASRGIEDIYELTYIRKDGSRFPAVVSVTALRDAQDAIIGYLLISTDNTARKHVEEKLRWTEESFRLMVESVTDYAIVMLDTAGCVMSWNAGAERIKGYTAEDIVGQHFSQFYLEEDLIHCKPQRDLDAVIANGRFEDEGWRVRKDKSSFWANVVYTAIRDNLGNLRGFAKLTRDLTERRQVEITLTNAKSAAEKANQAKSDFLSSMSHELRSPLNAILGFAQLMESDLPPPTSSQMESIEQILNGGWYLLDLINEILDLAVIESGKVSLLLESVSLAEVMLECQTMIEPQAQKRGIHMTFPQFDISCFVQADRTRVKQVMINLLSNSIKYNQKNGTVAVVVALSSPERIRISVTDTGAGLSPEKMEQLFQPFNRLGQENGATEGTGIGLVVTKRLVELMGGVIGVESTIGVGSVFWIELIASTSSQYLSNMIIESALTVVQIPFQNNTILHTLLYVEDNSANLKLVEQLIARRPDMKLLSAGDGLMGIEIARKFQPKVILMDINLPGISGIEVLKILREDPTTAHIPVVAISANAIPRDIEIGLEAGFFRYLTKPVKVNEFFSTLDEALEFANKEINLCK
ncbi:hybrid sensor histidine kinase/response regulator [Methylobacter psychrophilus]|uniref:hybrid sensor histidine kinase/response regulator n=1 Tax=Methylobacter psychrophilus TaxID=96941 RepID=UPI0021D500EF|nr:PAS domain S-box protein [Methylobacter psychrophilus]